VTPRYLTATDAGIMVGLLIMGFGLILAAALKFFANKSREEYRLDAEAMEEGRFLEAIENERRLYLPAAEAEVELFLDPHWKPAKASAQPSFVDCESIAFQRANAASGRRLEMANAETQAVVMRYWNQEQIKATRGATIKARAEEYRRNDGADPEANDPARENYAAANAVERSDEDNLAFMEQQANDLDVRRRAQAALANQRNVDALATARMYQNQTQYLPGYCTYSKMNCPMGSFCQLRHTW
jgi:hypothetical protein